MAKEILELDDIKLLVNTFYTKVRQDALLGPVFDERIKDSWPRHLDIMYRFWQTVLLGERTYSGSPMLKHVGLPVNETHFQRWIALFYETVDGLFTGEVAEEAKWRAGRMAEMFQYKLAFMQSRGAIQ